MHHFYLDAIKTFEGFTARAKWDYAQNSNGFGTKALYPGETISPEEAEQRFAAEITAARTIVEKHAQGWDEGTKAALTSLTFNAGNRWISSGLGEAVRNHDIQAVKERFAEYTKAQGQELPGLVKRRLAEIEWIGNAAPSIAPSADTETFIPAPHRVSNTNRLPTSTGIMPTERSSSVVTTPDQPLSTPTVSPRTTVPRAVALSASTDAAARAFGEGTPVAPAQWTALVALLLDLQLQSSAAEAERMRRTGPERRMSADLA